MQEIDLINSPEKGGSEIPKRILKLEGYISNKNQKEKLEIIIFKVFSNSKTHSVELDFENSY
tara:strand:- start:505 stop:690 length:186 start_codon:yes stop_codon:yes gene_type:complete